MWGTVYGPPFFFIPIFIVSPVIRYGMLHVSLLKTQQIFSDFDRTFGRIMAWMSMYLFEVNIICIDLMYYFINDRGVDN